MFILAIALLLTGQAAPPVQPTSAESALIEKIKTLRHVSPSERPAATRQLALDIRALPAGMTKLKLANSLSHLATEGDAGKDTLTQVVVTLADSLEETPVPAPKDHPDAVPAPYTTVVKIIRYEHLTVDPKLLANPYYAKAEAEFARQDEQVGHADFTLTVLKGKPVKLSDLKGQVVLVNFWATWCPPCRAEMPALDAIYQKYKKRGLVVLSISDEDQGKVAPFIADLGYHPVVLLDPGGSVHKQFDVDGIPKSFVFDRDGKLVAQTIDERTEHQFLEMLALAGLQE